jgi:hypothetical protein
MPLVRGLRMCHHAPGRQASGAGGGRAGDGAEQRRSEGRRAFVVDFYAPHGILRAMGNVVHQSRPGPRDLSTRPRIICVLKLRVHH